MKETMLSIALGVLIVWAWLAPEKVGAWASRFERGYFAEHTKGLID